MGIKHQQIISNHIQVTLQNLIAQKEDMNIELILSIFLYGPTPSPSR